MVEINISELELRIDQHSFDLPFLSKGVILDSKSFAECCDIIAKGFHLDRLQLDGVSFAKMLYLSAARSRYGFFAEGNIKVEGDQVEFYHGLGKKRTLVETMPLTDVLSPTQELMIMSFGDARLRDYYNLRDLINTLQIEGVVASASKSSKGITTVSIYATVAHTLQRVKDSDEVKTRFAKRLGSGIYC